MGEKLKAFAIQKAQGLIMKLVLHIINMIKIKIQQKCEIIIPVAT